MNQSDKPQKPQIIPLPNGPYYYFTKFEPKTVDGIINSKQERLQNIPGVALCRCEGSENKPFCDAKHKQCGFEG